MRSNGVQKALWWYIQSVQSKKQTNKETKILSTKNLIATKTIIQKWRQSKSFPDKQDLREFVANWYALREILKFSRLKASDMTAI